MQHESTKQFWQTSFLMAPVANMSDSTDWSQAIKDSRLCPRMRNTLSTSTAEVRCVQQGLQPRNVSQLEATQRGPELKRWLTSLGQFKPCGTPYMFYYVKIWCHPENQKYTKYCTVVRGGLSHSHRQYVQKISWSLDAWFFQIYKPTDRHTYRDADCNTWHPSQGQSNKS